MAKTARDRAQAVLDGAQTRLDRLVQRRDDALAAVEERFADGIAAATQERDHSASHPALAEPQDEEAPGAVPNEGDTAGA